MRCVIAEIQAHGEMTHPSAGDALELTGVLIEVANPRARLSRTETRGKLFSCLGELCWYLAKSKDLSFITYYIPKYADDADGDEISGGYGPRLFNWRGLNQVEKVTDVLRSKPDSRQAVIQLFDAGDLHRGHKSIPCTGTLQFLLRGGALHMFASMRSNDVFLGLPHDVFCFTMLQEIIASELCVELGTYKQAVGSLHLYTRRMNDAKQFLNEGWQPTEPHMPMMPRGNPWPAITLLLEAESQIRNTGELRDGILTDLDPYWADLIRLLLVFKCKKDKDANQIKELCGKMVSKFYFPFIEKVLSDLT
ncbi:MAG: thymidylate synthase [Acidobacteriia bacterium]|nr:thymidylate synthase [Terriglobia bacterium]